MFCEHNYEYLSEIVNITAYLCEDNYISLCENNYLCEHMPVFKSL